MLPLLIAALALPPFSSSFAPTQQHGHVVVTPLQASRRHHDNTLFAEKTTATDFASSSKAIDNTDNIIERVGKAATSFLLAVTISFTAITSPFSGTSGDILSSVPPAHASDGAAIGLCLLKKCRLPLAKCIANPNCLANVICINSCNGKPDESGCQIECGNIFENDVVGEFNKCAVSDMTCVPQKADDGSYPVPSKDKLVPTFNTNLWNGRWYITAGQNKLFDVFPCQVHFFTETEPGKFIAKINWRIEEPDGEYFNRDAVQTFVQDPSNPAHLINHDNDYLHYQDDWYILDYATDDNKEGVPPFAFVYYRGENDAWVGYGGAVVYTRDSKLPEVLLPRLREAAKKVNFDFDKDFEITDNTCKVLKEGEEIILREKFAGKMAIQTEKQLQQQAVLARTAATNEVGVAEKAAEKALQRIEEKALQFEKELAQDGTSFH
jgi:violaxanthin de-epoxidase